MDIKESINEFENNSDWKLVNEHKDSIADALYHEVHLKDIFKVLKKYNFQGNRYKLSKYLQKLGVRTIRVRNKQN